MKALERYSVFCRIICLLLLLLVYFPIAQNCFAEVEEGNCDDINELVDYGVIGETSFQYGNNSEINSNTITDSGNTPTPEGVCETIDLDFPPIDPEVFPSTGSTDLKPPRGPVAAGEYGTIEFKATGNNDTVTFSGGDYYIRELAATNGATVQLAPGNYFIERLTLDNKSEITITPSGRVNLYIKESFQAGNESKFNLTGDTGDFVVYLYDSASLQIGNGDQGNSGFDFNGIIYAPGASSSIQFGNNNNITGAILSAGSVEVGNNTEFDYGSDVQSEVLDALGCATPASQLVAYYPLESNVSDASGNGHNGISQETVAYDRGKICDGLVADGGGYLLVPDHDDFDLADELTVMAWLRPESLSVAGHDNLYSFLSKDTNYEFHLQSNGSIYWWWGNGSITTASGLITEGTWHHVAFVYSRSAGTMQIYADGTLAASRSYSASLPLNNDPFYIGTDMNTGGGEMPGRRFYGAIDEVRVYSGALSAAQIGTLMNEADPCQVAIDHYEIIHDSSALTCSAEAVTVRACVDAECANLYSEDVTIELSPSGWVNGDSQTLSSGSGVFYLRHTSSGKVSLSVSSQEPAADSGPVCVDGAGGASCDLTFYNSGFIFDVPDHRSCSTQADITIAAVRADATAEHCVGDYSFAKTTRQVSFWSVYQQPATGTQALRVNGTEIGGASPGTAIELTFNDQAESDLDLRYDDAGRLQLSASFAGSGEEDGLVMTGSDNFVVAPDRLRVVATSDGTAALDNATASGDPHWPAGQNFYVDVVGVCSDGTVTENFSATTTLSSVTPFSPATGTIGTLTGGPLTAGDYSNGVAQIADAAYSEVGTVTIRAEALAYLGGALDVVGSSGPVGRFTPHHFAVSLNSPQFAAGCNSGSFTYLGQGFDYVTVPVITVTAQNLQNGTTQNYTGAWWKISTASLSGKSYSAALGSVDTSGIPATDPTVADLGGGMGLLTFGSGSGLSMQRSDPLAPFDAEISLEINVLDGDGIAYADNPVRFGEATAGNGIAFDTGKEMRWGRVVLHNAYGSELLPLDMPLQAEYFDGTAFVFNSDDSCTSLALPQLSLANEAGTMVSAESPISVGSSGTTSASLSNPFLAGDANLSFSAPEDEGYVDVTANLTLLDWLRYDWDGDGSHDDDPQGRATFGIYRGQPNLIYLRETYR